MHIFVVILVCHATLIQLVTQYEALSVAQLGGNEFFIHNQNQCLEGIKLMVPLSRVLHLISYHISLITLFIISVWLGKKCYEDSPDLATETFTVLK